MPEIDIFVPKDQEESYLAQNHLKRVKTPNGVTILSGIRKTDDAANVDLGLQIPRGMVYDPPNKRGFVHLFEHFVATEPLKVSGNFHDNYFNAYTGSMILGWMLKGVANPRFREYGIWPVLSSMLSEITSVREVTEQRLVNEQNVVLEEMAQNLAKPERMATEHLLQVIYGPTNPVNIMSALEQQRQITNVTLNDVSLNSAKIIHPEKMVARIYVEGPEEIKDLIAGMFTDNLGKLSTDQEPFRDFDQTTVRKINEATVPGQFFFCDHGIRNKQIIAYYAWIRESSEYSLEAYADDNLFSYFERQAFHYLRARGMIYSGNKQALRPGVSGAQTLAVQVAMQKNGQWEGKIDAISQILKEQVLANISEDDLLRNLRIRQSGIAAKPVSVAERLTDCFNSTNLYDGKLISTDQVNKIYGTLTLDDLKKAYERFLDTPPIVVVTGDLA